MKLEIKQGIAENVKHTTSVHGSSHQGTGSVSTTNITLFLVNGIQTKMTARNPVLIENNDKVYLAGSKNNNGIFNILAYKNLSTQVSERVSIDIWLGMGISLILLGILFLSNINFGHSSFSATFGLISLMCIGIGALLLYKVKIILQAFTVVRNNESLGLD